MKLKWNVLGQVQMGYGGLGVTTHKPALMKLVNTS